MSTYWTLLEGIRGSKLRLTKMDDEIYEHFKSDFPDIDPSQTIDEEKMKSKAGKEKWRNFMMQYEKKVDDYNFGTMLRSNPKFEYGEKETIFGMVASLLAAPATVLIGYSYANAVLRHRNCTVSTKLCEIDMALTLLAIGKVSTTGYMSAKITTRQVARHNNHAISSHNTRRLITYIAQMPTTST